MGLFSRTKASQRQQPARRRRSADVENAAKGSSGRESQNHYRRGRTIAASTYTRKNSASEKIHGNYSPREKAHRLNNMRRKVMAVLITLCVLCAVLAAMIWSFTASVLVTFPNASSIPERQQYEAVVQDYLTKNPTERLRFNLNEARLSEFAMQENPEIARITQDGFAGFAKTTFSIELRQPVVSWQVGRTQYFVDKDGVSFSRNVFQTPEVTIVDNSGVEHTTGTAIASARFLSFVGRTVAIAQDRGLTVTQVAIPAGTSRQVELIIKDVAYPLILSIDRSPGEQVEDGMRAIAHFANAGRTPTYVDVRVKGRAFFREP